MAIDASGSYGFDQRLDFNVEAKPLGDSRLAEAFRLLTLPVSSLLKFRLEGTLKEPQWSADNWSKELLGGGGEL